MMSFLKNQLREIRTALWFRPTIFCLTAVFFSFGISVVDMLVPDLFLTWIPIIEIETVRDLLRLLAGSMLTVTTVVLSVLMLVISLATNQASPRAIPELMADRVTQNALGTFLSTFVYALTALLLLGAGKGSETAVTLNFFVSLLLVALSVKYLLQWIHHVAQSMKLNRIIEQVHKQAVTSLEAYLSKGSDEQTPAMMGLEINPAAIFPNGTGYVQLVDEEKLCELADGSGLAIRMTVQEGDFAHRYTPLMKVCGNALDDELRQKLSDAVVVGFERSADGDPRLSFELLAEIACRALSPGINDPQSAIVCIDYLGSLLAIAGAKPSKHYPDHHIGECRVSFLRVDFEMMLARSFRPIIRDSADYLEVSQAILNVLHALSQQVEKEYLDAIERETACLLAQAETSALLADDKKELSDSAMRITSAVKSR